MKKILKTRFLSLSIFSVSLLYLVYTFIIFPIIFSLINIYKNNKNNSVTPKPALSPNLSIIVAVHNEERVIKRKINNLLLLNIPSQEFEIIIVSEGSNDKTNEIILSFKHEPVRLIILPRTGKNKALNAAVAIAKYEVIVFTDADWGLFVDALGYLIAHFSDSEVGGVGGAHHYGFGQGTHPCIYPGVNHSSEIVKNTTASGSSFSGAIYAVRKQLYQDIPSGAADDFYTSMQVILAGKKLVYEPRAIAYELERTHSKDGFVRKLRVLRGWYYGLILCKNVLNPLSYRWFSIQLISHKLLRRVAIIPIILISIICTKNRNEHTFFMTTLSVLYMLFLLLMVSVFFPRSRRKLKVLRLIYKVFIENLASLCAIALNLIDTPSDIWETHRIKVL